MNNENRIKPYSKNPSYWQYKGRPILLIGGSDDDNLFQWTDNNLTDHLDLLISVGGNFVRNTMSDRDEGNVFAFKEIEPKLYDLNQWNDEYWERLHFFLEETKTRDIIVQLTVWDQWDLTIQKLWDVHPWNSKCNVNYEVNDLSTKSDFFNTVTNKNEKVLSYQNKYVEKLLETTLNYNHVLYNINNESWAGLEWENYWAEKLLTKARNQQKEIEITTMQLHAEGSVKALCYYKDLYSFVDISQINQDANGSTGQGHWDMLMSLRTIVNSNRVVPINNEKIYGSQGEESGPIFTFNKYAGTKEEAIQRFWRDIIGGCASARFHRPDTMYWGIGLTKDARIQLLSMSKLIEKFDIYHCEPNNNLLDNRKDNEAYCNANIGKKYAVYFPDGGSVDLITWSYSEEMTLEWLNISESEWLTPEKVKVKWDEKVIFWETNMSFRVQGKIPLNTPGSGPWVAVITV